MTDRAVPQSRVRARLAGVLFLFGVLTAASAELFLRGRCLAFAAGLIAALCHVAARLLFYQIFKLVSPSHALLAVSFNFARTALEAVRWNPEGVDIAVVFHGWYGLLSLSIRAVLVRILRADDPWRFGMADLRFTAVCEPSFSLQPGRRNPRRRVTVPVARLIWREP